MTISDPTAHAPEFSVIIPTHDRPDMLHAAIDSVRAQVGVGAVEIVVVDDGSDPPADVDDDVVLVRHDVPKGPGASRNAGVAASSGRAVTFLDDDDLWLPERLLLARRGLERAPIAVCWSRYVQDGHGTGRGRTLEGDVSRSIREGMTPNLGQTAVARSAWIPLDETLTASDDVDWWIRVTREHRVATEAAVGFTYRLHDGPRSATTAAKRVADGLRILEDHDAYFSANRRARAFHWFRLGLTAGRGGDRRFARRALVRSLLTDPHPRTGYHLLRNVGRSSARLDPAP